MGPYLQSSNPPRRFSPRREGRNRSPHQPLWRSRSPYSDSSHREMTWSRGALKRLREASPPGQDFRQPRRERPPLPADKYAKFEPSARETNGRMPLLHRSRSPLHPIRRDRASDISVSQKRPSSAKGDLSPVRTHASGSIPDSRPSSPANERPNTLPHQIRDRSPLHRVPARCQPRHLDFSNRRDGRSGLSSDKLNLDEARSRLPDPDQAGTNPGNANKDKTDRRPSSDAQFAEKSHITSFHPGNVPTQPKAYSTLQTQVPPSGPSHGLKALPQQIRGSNMSLLSAPTRPRGATSFKDNSWIASSMRRGGVSIGLHGHPPTGPRNSITPTTPTMDGSRNASGRQNSVTGNNQLRPQNGPNHLMGLRAIIPGGKPFTSGLSVSLEKRLSQLESDKDRLVEQASDNQRLNRLSARDWGRLDRESSICALKSELADGHLQRISDNESMHLGTTF
ncbi:uncharacterized protein BP01DRAFT_359982 [Aspergillus saccharolyticus JOP 1030-1]|uniref:Serine/arginine repetitive matrix protein 1 n=1 Tax=Aspergillus saccharolyticus JOP 1030-1 TaxID=1450539 RepID=A0A318Z3K6_9EURO|nr:hypothetical protein BP01DRAFT_359982 [Aspergillus saccharolyticus JOP 1030-1]PYH41891.1 hypothetical protein BP01DRAFT_359982 [Aspergillus saccharolyticus JOP 1030-1]